MLKIPHSLPDHIVLEPASPGFSQLFADSQSTWFCAETAFLGFSTDPETSPDWQARCGDKIASPARPNTGNSQTRMVAGISCLAFQQRLNCGYVLDRALTGQDPFSVAVIYATKLGGEPSSLVTVNPVDHDNYLFLSERDGAVQLTDNQGSFFLSQPVAMTQSGFRLAIFSRSKNGYALRLEGQETLRHAIVADSPDSSGDADLFMGCRSHRKGILKTLGALSLADVFLWPDKDILESDPEMSKDHPSPEQALLSDYYSKVIRREL